jgi:ribosomal protein S18 acetylase RimI-like enzyme
MTVRAAQETDFSRVTELLEELGRAEVTDDSYALARQVYLNQLEDPDASHMVAIDNGVVAGFCSLHFRTRLNHSTPQAWIPDLYVDPATRGRGAAKALLIEAERMARERGCYELVLESAFDRSEAHLLYSAAGMQETGRAFRKPL